MGITGGLVVGLRGMIPPAFAGLALAYAGQLTGILQNTVRWASETESRCTSVQRMQTSLKVCTHCPKFENLSVIKKSNEIFFK
jgi:ATP-binding cassette subfamily C (CFTR/MRP) protein 5